MPATAEKISLSTGAWGLTGDFCPQTGKGRSGHGLMPVNQVLDWNRENAYDVTTIPQNGRANMTSTPSASLDQIVGALQHSPLFQLSLASKELFHSNFLAWLCDTYRNHAGRLFAGFLTCPTPSYDGLCVRREEHNIDVRIEYPGGGELLIENKVKSLPRKEQLEEYAKAFSEKAQTSFLLLSLTRPAFLSSNETTIRLPDGAVWQCLTYRELADRLNDLLPNIKAINDYHGLLLHDYINFIIHLDALQTRFIIDWDDERANFFVAQSDIKLLKSIRLHDLVDKLRYAQLSQRVSDALRSDGFLVSNENLRDGHGGQPGQVLVSFGMTRGVGLFDLKYFVMNKDRLGNPVILGVQVQGNHFRLVVEVWDKKKAREIAMALRQPGGGSKLWFDFRLVPNGSEEYPKEGAFNQYDQVFFYRSKRLGSTAPKSLVDAIVAYARLARTNEADIRQQIETVL